MVSPFRSVKELIIDPFSMLNDEQSKGALGMHPGFKNGLAGVVKSRNADMQRPDRSAVELDELANSTDRRFRSE
jgi:hypothetical protein